MGKLSFLHTFNKTFLGYFQQILPVLLDQCKFFALVGELLPHFSMLMVAPLEGFQQLIEGEVVVIRQHEVIHMANENCARIGLVVGVREVEHHVVEGVHDEAKLT